MTIIAASLSTFFLDITLTVYQNQLAKRAPRSNALTLENGANQIAFRGGNMADSHHSSTSFPLQSATVPTSRVALYARVSTSKSVSAVRELDSRTDGASWCKRRKGRGYFGRNITSEANFASVARSTLPGLRPAPVKPSTGVMRALTRERVLRAGAHCSKPFTLEVGTLVEPIY